MGCSQDNAKYLINSEMKNQLCGPTLPIKWDILFILTFPHIEHVKYHAKHITADGYG